MRSVYFFLIGLILVSAPAMAKCPIRNLVYTDGIYELHFEPLSEENNSPTQFPFRIVNSKDSLEFTGTIGYGSGYSTPQVGISIPCHEGETNKSQAFCGYRGTVYEVDGENTTYAFSGNRDDNQLILFPDLNKKFYYARVGKWDYQAAIPKDVWRLKGCAE